MNEDNLDIQQPIAGAASGVGPSSVSQTDESGGLGMMPAYQLDTLRSVHQSFLQDFAQACAEELEIPVSATLADLRPVPLSEFLGPDYEHACLVPLQVDPSFGRAYLSMEPGFTFRILNMLLGAPQDQGVPPRAMATEIELHIMRDILQLVVASLQSAWSRLNVRFAIASGEGFPGQDSTRAGTVIVLRSAIKLGDYEEAFRLALPALLVRVAAMKADSPVPSLDHANPDVVAALRSAKCQIEAVLEGSTIFMSDLLRMEVGQILTLGPSGGARFACTVNGSPKFSGEPIRSGGRQALQIEAVL